MYVFTRKSTHEVLFAMFSYKTCIGECSSSSITSDYWIFTQIRLSSIYRQAFLCLDETSHVACNSVRIQTHKVLLLFGGDRLSGKLSTVTHTQLKLNASQDGIQNIPSFIRLGSLVEQKTSLLCSNGSSTWIEKWAEKMNGAADQFSVPVCNQWSRWQ